ncbi:MAG: oligosaccharide flippase family protein [Acidovorax sp.]
MGIAVVRLLSSVVLTRILYPEAFGLMAIVSSIAFVVEMLSDVGIVGLIIRHEKSEEPRFFNTWWSVRLVRSWINAGLMFLLAPYMAQWYGEPELTLALRIFSLSFVIRGFESMAVPLSIRRRQTQRMNYIELGCLAASTCFSIAWSYFSRDYFGILYGILFNQLLAIFASYYFYPRSRIQLHFDREALREQFRFARYVMPSSMITLVVNQSDKFLFLKFFNLHLMGLYGMALNILAPIEALTSRLSRNMLYPRCAENYRNDPSTFVEKYYTESWKLHALTLAAPALLCGMGTFVIQVLYDPRYSQAGVMLQLVAIRSVIHVYASTAEDLLVASGLLRIQLTGNILRLLWLVPALLLGSYYFGLHGFLVAMMLEMAPTLLYYLWILAKQKMVIWRYEGVRLLFTLAIAAFGAIVAAAGTQLISYIRAA